MTGRLIGIIFCMLVDLAQAKTASLLPKKYEKQVRDILTSLNLSESNLSKVPHVKFKSAESKNAHGSSVTNRVHYWTTSGYDLWLMRQNQSTEDLPIADWSMVGIIVFKKDQTKEAVYFEIAEGDIAPFEMPNLIKPRVSCLRCHASGPRAIRPENQKVEVGAGLWKEWNHLIAEYGIVKDLEPDGLSLVPKHAIWQEELKITSCIDCHSEESGVRGPLKRIHYGSIRFLLGYGKVHAGKGMPPEDIDSLDSDEACLEDWLKDPNTKACRGTRPVSKAETRIAPQQDYDWDIVTSESQSVATVAYTLGDFEVKGAGWQGGVKCQEDGPCMLEASLPIAVLDTGIGLRTSRLQEKVLNATDYPVISLNAELQVVAPGKGMMNTKLSLNGVTKLVEAAYSCEKNAKGMHCRSGEVELNLEDFNLKMPQILHIRVEPKIVIKTNLVLVAGAVGIAHQRAVYE